ncbi:MAG: glycosyltransferase family 9 protein [Paludibacteraceae bacterium]|nr:glycosyltransferase family 9 protein [Paludibacteraceae bacterium]
MTYLILRFSSLGDVAMTVPVIASLSALQPDDQFIVVSQKRLQGMFYGMPNVHFHEADLRDGWWKSTLRLHGELAAYKPDVVLDMQDVPRTWLLRLLFRVHGVRGYSIDRGRTGKRVITWLGARYSGMLVHETGRYADVCRRAGLATSSSFTSLPVNEAAAQAVTERYGEAWAHEVGIAPFAKSKSNMLPYQTVKEVIHYFSSQPKTRVFLFGAGRIETEMLRQWAEVFPNVVSVAGELPLESELELMRRLEGMICMDSANQHLCSLVGLRAVSVWCATHPKTGFYGWKQDPHDIIQMESLSCRPCSVHGTNHCRFRNFACKAIMAEQIIERYRRM